VLSEVEARFTDGTETPFDFAQGERFL